ncbi:uncharacterized protein LOC118740173 [Rhagoletis pomonella]|uniref:uncharacterized protein LOC118740173 n=1 Tax=Rhagoletis pomonella TaxID=28610 RepID=UPI00177D5E69|nr:uncharacterized protein LOC118740173 [Rhagoletis pomonella]
MTRQMAKATAKATVTVTVTATATATATNNYCTNRHFSILFYNATKEREREYNSNLINLSGCRRQNLAASNKREQQKQNPNTEKPKHTHKAAAINTGRSSALPFTGHKFVRRMFDVRKQQM